MKKQFAMVVSLLFFLSAPQVFAAPAKAQPKPAPVQPAPETPDEQAGDTMDDGTPAPAAPASPAGPAAPPAAPAGPIAPEQYFQLLLDRQRLSIESYKQINKILDANPKDPLNARKEMEKNELETARQSQALFEKYSITPEDYYRNYLGTEVQAQRSAYLKEHPEVAAQLLANSSELRAIEKSTWDRLSALWNRPAPPPPKKTKKR